MIDNNSPVSNVHSLSQMSRVWYTIVYACCMVAVLAHGFAEVADYDAEVMKQVCCTQRAHTCTRINTHRRIVCAANSAMFARAMYTAFPRSSQRYSPPPKVMPGMFVVQVVDLVRPLNPLPNYGIPGRRRNAACDVCVCNRAVSTVHTTTTQNNHTNV